MSTSISPHETDTPLVVDTDAVLPSTVALELLQSVARRDSQVLDMCSGMDNLELAEHSALDPAVQ